MNKKLPKWPQKWEDHLVAAFSSYFSKGGESYQLSLIDVEKILMGHISLPGYDKVYYCVNARFEIKNKYYNVICVETKGNILVKIVYLRSEQEALQGQEILDTFYSVTYNPIEYIGSFYLNEVLDILNISQDTIVTDRAKRKDDDSDGKDGDHFAPLPPYEPDDSDSLIPDSPELINA